MLLRVASRARGDTDDRRLDISGQTSTGQKRQVFGRIDPVCMLAVVPMLLVAGLFLWGGVPIVGVVLIVLALLVVVFDSWANRPIRKPAPRYREDY